MAKYTRSKTLNFMKEIGLVPVFYNPEIEISKKIVKACYEGGATCVEMTNRGDHAIEVFSELEKYCQKTFPQLIIGVGSIVDAPTAALYIAHGANFVVGPVLDRDTAILCNIHKIPYIPGCGSATEIHEAHKLGADIVKVFPGAEVGGPAFVKAIKGPCPWTEIMPTGGVDATRESLTEWFSAGVSCVGIGSNLITKEIINKNDYTKLTDDVKKVISIIHEIRENLSK